MGKEVYMVLEKFGTAIVKSMKNTITKNRKINTGRLLNSIMWKITDQNNVQTLEIIAIDYAKYVDSGRRVGSIPPYKPILEWFKGKNGGAFIRTARIKRDQQHLKSAAISVAKSIGKKKIPPVKFLNRKQQFENITTFKKELTEAMIRDSQIQKIITK